MSKTETENFGTDALNRRVAQAVASGVKPIELLLEPIYGLGDGKITAYRANCRIHRLHVGTLMPAELFGAAGSFSACDLILCVSNDLGPFCRAHIL